MLSVTDRGSVLNGGRLLKTHENLFIWQEQAQQVIIENEKAIGVETSFGTRFYSKAVILTNGTFLNGLMHVGFRNIRGGRSGEQASYGLSDQLKSYGFTVERMKTGTSARVDGRTIDFSVMTEQKGDNEGRSFSYMSGILNIRRSEKLFYHSYK